MGHLVASNPWNVDIKTFDWELFKSFQSQGNNYQLYEGRPLDKTGKQFGEKIKTSKQTMSALKKGGSKTSHFKAMPGRRRKLESWKKLLYREIFKLFDRLGHSGVNISPTLLKFLATYLLEKSNHLVYNAHILAKDGTSILGKIKPHWCNRSKSNTTFPASLKLGICRHLIKRSWILSKHWQCYWSKSSDN